MYICEISTHPITLYVKYIHRHTLSLSILVQGTRHNKTIPNNLRKQGIFQVQDQKQDTFRVYLGSETRE